MENPQSPQSTFLTEYFYGDEADQFSYFRIPRLLITSPRFNGISVEAKLLYGLMLDRMGLSYKNGWYDPDGRVYIYYTIEEIAEDLNCKRDKAMKLLAELDPDNGIGLVIKKRQGQGKPSKLYVKRFTSGKKSAGTDFKKSAGTDFKKSAGADPKKSAGADPKKSAGADPSYLDNIYPDNSNPQSVNPSILPSTGNPASARAGAGDGLTDGRAVREKIKKQIDYDFLPFRLDGWALRQADELLELMVEVALTQSPTVQIGRAAYPTDYVQERFARIGLDHIEAILRGLKENEGRVTNVRAYLLASLFNSVATMDNATALSCTG